MSYKIYCNTLRPFAILSIVRVRCNFSTCGRFQFRSLVEYVDTILYDEATPNLIFSFPDRAHLQASNTHQDYVPIQSTVDFPCATVSNQAATAHPVVCIMSFHHPSQDSVQPICDTDTDEPLHSETSLVDGLAQCKYVNDHWRGNGLRECIWESSESSIRNETTHPLSITAMRGM